MRSLRPGRAGLAAVSLLCLGTVSAAGLPAGGDHPCTGTERARGVMGTTARVLICDPMDGTEAALACEAALDAIDRVDRVMSLYRPDSDLSRLNREGYPGPVPLDRDLIDLLDQTRELASETSGKFDVTIEPLMEAYGFYDELGLPGRSSSIEEAISRIGIEGLTIDREAMTASFRRRGMGVDLGGIAKGFALDRAAAALRARGVKSAYIDLGRSLIFVGPGPGRDQRWPAAIVDPLDPERLSICVEVPEGSLSTSARFGRSAGGAAHPIGHILDPQRGAVESRRLQATVWSPSASRADALSTSLLLLDRDAASALLAANGELGILMDRCRLCARGYTIRELPAGGMFPGPCGVRAHQRHGG